VNLWFTRRTSVRSMIAFLLPRNFKFRGRHFKCRPHKLEVYAATRSDHRIACQRLTTDLWSVVADMRSYGSLLVLLSLPNLDYPGGNLSSCKDNPATLGAAMTRKYEVFVSPLVTRVSQPPTYVAGRRDLSPPQINAAASRRINSAAKDRKLDVFFDGPRGHQRTSQVYSAVWAPLVAPSHIVAAATPPHLVPLWRHLLVAVVLAATICLGPQEVCGQ